MSDRERADFRAAVEAMLPTIVYLGKFPGKVVVQDADGTLQIECDDERIGTITKVPIKCGIPNAKVTVAAGTRVRVGFEGGDMDKKYADDFDYDSAPTKAIARVDDTTDGGTLTWHALQVSAPPLFPSAGFYLQHTPPGGLPGVPVLLPGLPPPIATAAIPISLNNGKITSGSSKVNLG